MVDVSHPTKPTKQTEIKLEHTYKGCVHWYEFCGDFKAKTIDDIHPCIIIGKDNPKSKRVIISPISDVDNYIKPDGKLKYPYHVLLKKSIYKFLEKDCVVLLDQVFTIPREVLFEEWYMGQVDQVREIDEAIMQNYDLISTISDLLNELVEKIVQEQNA